MLWHQARKPRISQINALRPEMFDEGLQQDSSAEFHQVGKSEEDGLGHKCNFRLF